jgi:1,4-dihydroxy-2-naphthoate polyprenyltransferase
LLSRSTIQLLRFPFSYFLMPVFWFALSFVHNIDWMKTVLIFVLLHFFLYPSSNGYNSFMDRDETSIGGIAKPMQPTKQLFYSTVVMDVIAVLLSLLVSKYFAIGLVCYVLCSRMYSWRGIRLKRFAVLGYITVILNQGVLVFCMVYHGADKNLTLQFPWMICIAAGFLIGGFYPITQIYQHDADKKDSVKTMSILLGKKGTFIFCAVMYSIAFGLLFEYYLEKNIMCDFFVLSIFFIPVIIFFLNWFVQVLKDSASTDFNHTMRMNIIASTCTNFAFITLLIINHFG